MEGTEDVGFVGVVEGFLWKRKVGELRTLLMDGGDEGSGPGQVVVGSAPLVQGGALDEWEYRDGVFLIVYREGFYLFIFFARGATIWEIPHRVCRAWMI